MPPIYDRSTRELLGDAAVELTAPFSVEDFTRWFEAKYPKLKVKRTSATFDDINKTLKLKLSDPSAPDVAPDRAVP